MPTILIQLATMAAAAAAQAGAAAAPLPQQVQALRDCRAITDTTSRLACYDRTAAALDQAVASRSVVVLGAEDVRRTKRSLFGFSLPRLPFFGGAKDDGDTPEEREIEGTLASATQTGYGRWRIRLEEGGVWETTEAASASNEPFAGAKVRIRRAALGSYLMNVGRSRALRVRRVG